MPRAIRVFLVDFLALASGFVIASLSMTVLLAARPPEAALTVAPTASLLSPFQGQFVSGTVPVWATASQDTDALQFQLGGANLGPAVTSGACQMNWDTTAVSDGTYTLSVLASDDSGDTNSSAPVTVTVQNNPPTPAPDAPVAPPAAGVPSNPSAGAGGDPGSSKPPVSKPAPIAPPSGDASGSSPPPPPAPPPPTQPPPPAGPPPPDPGTIDGVAVDPNLGVLANTIVFLVQAQNFVAFTMSDSNGHYQFTGLAPGQYELWILDAGQLQVLDVTVTGP
jgi:Bacterial Ig domain